MSEKKVLAALKRVIPGDYHAVCEASHETLAASGFTFGNAIVMKNPPKSVPELFFGETLAENREPMPTLRRQAGDWVFMLDETVGSGAYGLWLVCLMDYPDRFLRDIAKPQKGSAILLRPTGHGWLVGVQASFLRHLIKHNGQSGNL